MTITHHYERFTHTPRFALGAIDRFAAAQGATVIVDPLPNPPVGKQLATPILGDVNFYVTRRLTAPVIDYDPPLELVSWSNKSGFFLFNGDTQRANRAGALQLAEARYAYRVESDYYQPIVDAEIDWPPPAIYDPANDLEFLPGPNYPFPDLSLKQRQLGVTLLRGSLFQPGGESQKDIVVTLNPPPVVVPPGQLTFEERFEAFDQCTTDRYGNWVIALIEIQAFVPAQPGDQDPFADFDTTLHVDDPDGPYDVDVNIQLGQENTTRQTALRGKVVRAGGAPYSKVKVTNSVAAGESITGPAGQWFFYFQLGQQDSPVTVTATAPNGQTNSTLTDIRSGATGVVPTIELS